MTRPARAISAHPISRRRGGQNCGFTDVVEVVAVRTCLALQVGRQRVSVADTERSAPAAAGR